MKKDILTFLICLFCTTLSGQQSHGYRNPIIPGFHPDPSICRVDSDYYLVNSSFQYFPGVPIFHSRDLVNWEQIGNCLTRNEQLPLQDASCWGGIYAATIRYHDGVFYMITTNVTHGGNFLVYTTNPYGDWSNPVWINQGGIDPSLFWEDGHCYLVSNPKGIWLSEINPQTGEQITQPEHIWDGTGGRYPEAPHLIKKDGFYYLLISEGGTEYGHKVTIARSRQINGPYESNPSNPILTHINQIAERNPIQGTGHADLVQAHDGSWWMVCLGFRTQGGDHHLTGRETYLAPVRWDKNAWPVVNGNGTISLDMDVSTLPQKPFAKRSVRDNFDQDKLCFDWVYLRNPNSKNYVLKNGNLLLKASKASLENTQDIPTMVLRRQEDIAFTAGTKLQLNSSTLGDESGLSVYMWECAHYDLFIRQVEKDKQSLVLRYQLGELSHIEKEIPLKTANKSIELRVHGEERFYSFEYSTDGKVYIPLARIEAYHISTENAGGFTGVMLGLFATSTDENSNGIAQFNWFDYEAKD